MRIQYIDDKKMLDFGYCEVVQEKKEFNGVYRKGELLTHCRTWNRATKIAHLLNEAYKQGHESGYGDCSYAYDMDESYQY